MEGVVIVKLRGAYTNSSTGIAGVSGTFKRDKRHPEILRYGYSVAYKKDDGRWAAKFFSEIKYRSLGNALQAAVAFRRQWELRYLSKREGSQ